MSVVAAVLVGTGAAVAVLAALGALLLGRVRDRLHLLTPVTSIAAPLVGMGIAVDTGVHLATAMVLVTVAVLAGTGPALAAATGRVSAQRDGRIDPESPE